MKKPQKKHLFARTCRVLGRFLLVIGAVLCAASIVYAAAPLLYPTESRELTSGPNTFHTELAPAPATPATPSVTPVINNVAGYILPAVIIIAAFAIIIAVSFRHYNKSIRNLIAKFAKFTKLNIHTSELLLATVVWTIANFIIAFNAPVFAVLTFAAMIINNLFFIFAWTAYGCPTYTV